MPLDPNPSDDDLYRLLEACGLKAPYECGTVRTYMRHLSVGETPCQQCTTVFEEARKGWASKPRRRRPAAHGTTAGARAHQARKEPACGACVRAYRAYQKDRRDAAREKAGVR
jgi:hypothetical protein